MGGSSQSKPDEKAVVAVKAAPAPTFQPKININESRYDQGTYEGRAKHFFLVTNPANILATEEQLNAAKTIVDDYRRGKLTGIADDDLWQAKYLYDSAFHPVTGEKMNVVGRMSAQVPMNMLILGGMLTFYRSTAAVIFWQWFNQSFNALVNYTNRSGGSVDKNQLIGAYLGATGGALVTSLGLNKVAHRFPPLIGRWVPFMAVAAANCINIPLMRSQELKAGISVQNEKGEALGESVPAAQKAISQVVFSRIVMASPGMIIPPILMQWLEKRWPVVRRPIVNAPIQTLLCGVLLVFATPMCCALFPQKSSISVSQLEAPMRQRMLDRGMKDTDRVYFNKGL